MKLQIQNSTNQTYSEEYAGTGASVLVHDSHIEFPAGKLEYEGATREILSNDRQEKRPIYFVAL